MAKLKRELSKTKIGWFFGGRSAEHEVSVITALQAYKNLNKEKYEIIPIYVSKQGDFYTSPKFLDLKNYKDVDSLILSSTRITVGRKDGKSGFFSQGILNKFNSFDLAFPLFHGTFGEDGAFQGLLEMYQIPYVGFDVTNAALSMDKPAQKAIYLSLGLPVGKYFNFSRNDWIRDKNKILAEVKSKLKFPMIVKPATLGSSIGINKASDMDSLDFAIEVATAYDDKILIEEAFQNVIEVNCSAIGYEDVKASVCEMPIASEAVLSFADKYQKGGGKGSKGVGMASLSRIIPAPISKRLAAQIQETTIKIFKVMDGCGVARVDYFVDKKAEKFWVNEINSPPGSLAFYLWEKSGVPYPELLDMLIGFALKRTENQKKTQYTFNTTLLSDMASQKGGTKA